MSYQAQGNDVNVVLERWVTSQTDLATGCATSGHLEPLTGLTPNVDIQGAVNGPAISNYLPGFYGGSIPIERFGEAALNLSQILDDAPGDECFSFGSIWMHSRSSIARLPTSASSNMQDYVAPQNLALRTCAASGTKFHDLNANGRRERGEPGLPRWPIWADYDNDGLRDSAEPFGITDGEGQYVINDIRPPDGTYMLRETLPSAAARRRAARAGVTCSYPNAGTPGGTGSAPGGMFHCAWGPIDTATTTWARGRDFGNYVPPTLPEPQPPPPQPPAPPPPPPQPPAPPSPLVPPGPKPPDAGDAARAAFLVRQATRGCIRGRVPRLSFQGTRIARIQVFVNGNSRRRLTVQTLQRRVTPRLTLSPGSYRLAVRVTFQRGTGSPPVTFRRRIRICAVKAARPPFTG